MLPLTLLLELTDLKVKRVTVPVAMYVPV